MYIYNIPYLVLLRVNLKKHQETCILLFIESLLEPFALLCAACPLTEVERGWVRHSWKVCLHLFLHFSVILEAIPYSVINLFLLL